MPILVQRSFSTCDRFMHRSPASGMDESTQGIRWQVTLGGRKYLQTRGGESKDRIGCGDLPWCASDKIRVFSKKGFILAQDVQKCLSRSRRLCRAVGFHGDCLENSPLYLTSKTWSSGPGQSSMALPAEEVQGVRLKAHGEHRLFFLEPCALHLGPCFSGGQIKAGSSGPGFFAH